MNDSTSIRFVSQQGTKMHEVKPYMLKNNSAINCKYIYYETNQVGKRKLRNIYQLPILERLQID